jgi:hypothetical protein
VQPGLFPQGESIPALVVETDKGRRILRLEYLRRYPPRFYAGDWPEEQREPCVFIGPYGPEHTSSLGALWDRVALSDLEQEVVAALGIITPGIEAVSMIGGDKPRRERIAIARAKTVSHPVPLRSFGDGLNRLFGIVLSLVNAKEGLLLIDEVENGLHYRVQYDVWRTIFALSRRLDVQVFATSHSWDSVAAFQRAAAEDPETGVLVRLSLLGDNIVPTLFTERELAIATRDQIEVR